MSKIFFLVVKSFHYGQGPPEPASAEGLGWIGMHPEILKNVDTAELHTSRFILIHPGQGIQLYL